MVRAGKIRAHSGLLIPFFSFLLLKVCHFAQLLLTILNFACDVYLTSGCSPSLRIRARGAITVKRYKKGLKAIAL
jgi:hypothetical protein